MEIRINETKELETLEIVDPKTGCAWTADILGNYNAAMEWDDEDDVYTMDQDEYEWWKGLIKRYQAADDRCHEIRQSTDDYDGFQAHMDAFSFNDLEDLPEALEYHLDAWEKNNK